LKRKRQRREPGRAGARRSGAAAGRVHRLERTQLVPRHRDEVFAFFADASNLEAITPPFLRFRIVTPMPVEMRLGTRIDYVLSLSGVPLRWRTRITEWQPGVRFVDEQESGPYAFWRHAHEFESRGTSTQVRDVVDYAEPLGPLGRAAHVLFVERALRRIFDFRRHAIQRLLDRAVAPPLELGR
jgi:ligand-binding SRPBCC domain-containing protein